MMLNPYAWIVALVISIIWVVGAGVAGYRSGAAVVQSQWDASVLAKKKGEDAALKAAAEAIAKIEVKSETYIQPVRREVRTNTVYRECLHSDDSLRNLNALITGSQSTDYGLVPGTKPTR